MTLYLDDHCWNLEDAPTGTPVPHGAYASVLYLVPAYQWAGRLLFGGPANACIQGDVPEAATWADGAPIKVWVPEFADAAQILVCGAGIGTVGMRCDDTGSEVAVDIAGDASDTTTGAYVYAEGSTTATAGGGDVALGVSPGDANLFYIWRSAGCVVFSVALRWKCSTKEVA